MQSHRDNQMRADIRSITNSMSSCVRILCKCMRYFQKVHEKRIVGEFVCLSEGMFHLGK
jgi:hypothetical protein